MKVLKMEKNRVSSVLSDKLSGTLPVPDKRKMRVKNRLLEGMRYFKSKNIPAKHYPSQERYGNNFKFTLPTDTKEGTFDLKISIYPMNKSHNFFRIEFNPNKLGTKGGRWIIRILTKVLGADLAAKFFTEGRLTRLDLALNIRKPMGDYFIYMKGLQQSEIILGDGGTIESQVLGSPASSKRLTLYNKLVEQCLPDTGDKHWWRLEFVLRNLDCSIAEIDRDLLKHFKKISFYSRGLLDDEYFDQPFLQHVKEHGLNSALYPLDRNTKAKYLRRLTKYEIHPVDLQRLGFKRGLASLSFLDMGQSAEVAA
ncbi:MAG: hypothetical protein JSS37_10360 [Proteobacteria bacterium]|nr:hypothetical protein [Pseudomonadota bacterium]